MSDVIMNKIWIGPQVMSNTDIKALQLRFPHLSISMDLEPSIDCEAIICGPTFVNQEHLERLPNLRWIQLISAGYNQVNLNLLTDRKIFLTNARGIYSKTIAEDVFCKILTINRHVRYYYESMKVGVWKPISKELEICGSTIGILGAGSIASEIAKRMKAFDAHVIGYRKSLKTEPYFDEIVIGEKGLCDLLHQSDYVIVALPLNEETQGLINEERLRIMKPQAVLINIARGEIVVQDDLIKALKEKTIRAAGLDVMVPEPLPANSELWSLDSVFITPHNSASSPFISSRLLQLIEDNIERYQRGELLTNLIV